MTITRRKILQTFVLIVIVLNIACSAFYNLLDPTFPRGAEAILQASGAYATRRANEAIIEVSGARATYQAQLDKAVRQTFTGTLTLQAKDVDATYAAQSDEARATYQASDVYATSKAVEATYQASDAMATWEAWNRSQK